MLPAFLSSRTDSTGPHSKTPAPATNIHKRKATPKTKTPKKKATPKTKSTAKTKGGKKRKITNDGDDESQSHCQRRFHQEEGC
ncbi:hypothetical protein D6D29_10657 [Aureobasidium pullulans]|nr:hypothetical protein D6D29_10657 [Aureobasidium pullulans]